MYSDSDDSSQISQPHLQFILSKKDKIETKDKIGVGSKEDEILDKLQTDNKLIASNVNKLNLLSLSSKKSSMTSSTIDSSFEDYNEENDKLKISNKSQQTSPVCFSDYLKEKNFFEKLKKMNEKDLFYEIESQFYSPEITPFQSKHLKNWQYQQNLFSFKKNLNEEKFNEEKCNEEKCNKKQFGIFNFEFDEELFYKVKKLFPNVNDDKIRNLMLKHNNQEHDVIASTINSLSPKKEKKKLKHHSAMKEMLKNYIEIPNQLNVTYEINNYFNDINYENNYENNYAKVEIKLKYLKLLYPKAEELKLFNLLHDCDMKANIVAKKLEELGYERKKFSNSEESLISSIQEEELIPELKLNFGEQEKRYILLKKEYSNVDDYLIKLSLKCTKFDINQAKELLNQIKNQNYKNIKKTYELDEIEDESLFIYKYDRGVQTCIVDYFEFGKFYKVKRQNKFVQTACVSTWTGEDQIEELIEKKIAVGPVSKNIKGPLKKEPKNYILSKGSDPSLIKGNKKINVKGCDPYNVKGKNTINLLNSKSIANGSDYENHKGSFKNFKKSIITGDYIY